MRKGFTLIELLIVIAIIAILAAIAIPQFARYRIRAYNGSAESDLRNARTTEEAFFADWQTYGSTGAGLGSGAAVQAPNPVTITDGTHSETFNLSTKCGIVISTDANGTSYTMVTKHINGDTYFGADSDVQGIYFDRDDNNINNAVAAGDEPTPSPQNDDFNGVAGPSGNNWTLQ